MQLRKNQGCLNCYSNSKSISPILNPKQNQLIISTNKTKIVVYIEENQTKIFELLKYLENEKTILSNIIIKKYKKNTNVTLARLIFSDITKGIRCFFITSSYEETVIVNNMLKDINTLSQYSSYRGASVFNTNEYIESSETNLTSTSSDLSFLLSVLTGVNHIDKITTFIQDSKTYTKILFQKLCIIYQESNYCSRQLEKIISENNKLSTPLSIISYKVENSIPDELIGLLTENPISNPNFISSENKICFLLLSERIQDLIDIISTSYIDNYFFFLEKIFESIIFSDKRFPYGFVITNNYSQLGYMLSKKVDYSQSIPPNQLALIDLIIQNPLPTIYSRIASSTPNRLLTTINSQFKEKLSNLDYFNNNEWTKKQSYLFKVRINQPENEAARIIYYLVSGKDKYNPDTVVLNTSVTYETYDPNKQYLPGERVCYDLKNTNDLKEYYAFVCINKSKGNKPTNADYWRYVSDNNNYSTYNCPHIKYFATNDGMDKGGIDANGNNFVTWANYPMMCVCDTNVRLQKFYCVDTHTGGSQEYGKIPDKKKDECGNIVSQWWSKCNFKDPGRSLWDPESEYYPGSSVRDSYDNVYVAVVNSQSICFEYGYMVLQDDIVKENINRDPTEAHNTFWYRT
jgi:hypothetical protein